MAKVLAAPRFFSQPVGGFELPGDWPVKGETARDIAGDVLRSRGGVGHAKSFDEAFMNDSSPQVNGSVRGSGTLLRRGGVTGPGKSCAACLRKENNGQRRSLQSRVRKTLFSIGLALYLLVKVWTIRRLEIPAKSTAVPFRVGKSKFH